MDYKISKFWTRIGAILIDFILLGVFGYILGLLLEDLFVSLGSLGLVVGLIISLIYLSIGNSYLMRGQTLGKRALNIQTIKPNGDYLSIKESFVRAFVLCVPYFIVNLKIPGLEGDSILNLSISFLSTIMLIGIVLIYILNKSTRQSLHDLMVDSFVTEKEKNESTIDLKPIKKSVFYIYGAITVILIGLTFFNFFSSNKQISDTTMVYKELGEIEDVIRAAVSSNTTTVYGSEESITKSFVATLWVQNLPSSISEMETSKTTKSAIEIIFKRMENVNEVDVITVQLVRGFNIGIASKSNSFKLSKTPDEWKQLIK